ncbi:MAG: hypothetical protein ACRERW_07595 [Pseudomonas sp.]
MHGLAAYSNPQLPLAEGLVQALSNFILKQQPADALETPRP